MSSAPAASASAAGSGVDERRERILAAARSVFSRCGYHNAHLDEVAQLARVGKATLYQQFGSKDALLLAVATRGIEELRDHVVASLSPPGAPREVFGRAVRAALRFFEDNRGLLRILFLEASELQGELAARTFERYEAAKPASEAIFRSFADSRISAGHGPGALADLLMYLITGRLVAWLVTGRPERLSDDAELLVDVYVRGVFGEQPALAPEPSS